MDPLVFFFLADPSPFFGVLTFFFAEPFGPLERMPVRFSIVILPLLFFFLADPATPPSFGSRDTEFLGLLLGRGVAGEAHSAMVFVVRILCV